MSEPFVSAGFVAEPETNARPAFFRIGAAAVTSWLPAGPITPTMLEFDANDCDTVEAIAGSSCVSPWTMLILTACVLFHCVGEELRPVQLVVADRRDRARERAFHADLDRVRARDA